MCCFNIDRHACHNVLFKMDRHACRNVLLKHTCHNVLFKIGKHACLNGSSKYWQAWLLPVWRVCHMLRKDWYSYSGFTLIKALLNNLHTPIRIVDLVAFKVWQAPFPFMCLRRPDMIVIQRYCDCQTCHYIYWLKSSSDGHAYPYVLFKSVLMGTLASLCCSSVLVTGRLDI